MNWKDASEKPTPYVIVLLGLSDGHFTTGWWADKANDGEGCWIGLALNQSPPTYKLEDWAVIKHCEIEAFEGYSDLHFSGLLNGLPDYKREK